MITYICLMWIGKILNAPWWYFVALFIGILIKVLYFGYSVGEQKNNKARAPILGLFLFNVYPINKED